MPTEILTAKLYRIACASLSEANKHNPFITKRDAMQDINRIRQIDKAIHYYASW